MAIPAAVLGVDFGGVINDSGSHPSGDDTAFLTGGFDLAMQTPETKGSVEALARLAVLVEYQVWIVSKCGPRIQEVTRAWLRHHDFMARAAIPPSNVRFCRRRPEKAEIAADLGITHFVDDRADVIEHLAGVVPYRFLFDPSASTHPGDVISVEDWAQAEREIARTLSSAAQSAFLR